VQSVLAAHPEVLTFKESHFFDKGFRPKLWNGYRLTEERHTYFELFLQENELGTAEERRAWQADFRSQTTVQAAAAWLIRFLDHQAEQTAHTLWIEKTPDHVWRIPLIESVAPTARFVHIVRPPLPTITSLRQATGSWGQQRSWLHCLAHWRVSLGYSARYCGLPQHYFVFYDDFVNSPEQESARLLSWLDLPADAALLARRQDEAKNIVGSGESWKARTFGEIAPRSNPPAVQAPWPIRAYADCAWLYRRLYDRVSQQRLDFQGVGSTGGACSTRSN
jgi:hypothetical protein